MDFDPTAESRDALHVTMTGTTFFGDESRFRSSLNENLHRVLFGT